MAPAPPPGSTHVETSIADVVFARRPVVRASAPPASPLLGAVAIALFERRPPATKPVWTFAAVSLVVVLYAGAIVSAMRAPATPADPPPAPVSWTSIELLPPPAPEPPPEPAAPEPEVPPPAEAQEAPPTPAPKAPAPRARAEAAAKPADAPAPAQAGEVLTAEGTDAPVDFTGFEIVSGAGARFAGGSTSAQGTSKQAATGPVGSGPRAAAPRSGKAKSRARPVTLASVDWRDCPWPKAAQALSVDEQIVLLRVVTNAQGKLERVEIVADPGHGFAEQARKCAVTERWLPALDDDGRPYTATSPVFRLAFHR